MTLFTVLVFRWKRHLESRLISVQDSLLYEWYKFRNYLFYFAIGCDKHYDQVQLGAKVLFGSHTFQPAVHY